MCVKRCIQMYSFIYIRRSTEVGTTRRARGRCSSTSRRASTSSMPSTRHPSLLFKNDYFTGLCSNFQRGAYLIYLVPSRVLVTFKSLSLSDYEKCFAGLDHCRPEGHWTTVDPEAFLLNLPARVDFEHAIHQACVGCPLSKKSRLSRHPKQQTKTDNAKQLICSL